MAEGNTGPISLDGLEPKKDPPGVALGFALVTTFGLGHFRPASGTWGSLPPVALALGLAALVLATGSGWWVYALSLIVICLASCAACIFMGDRAEARFGRKDASEVVADETAGQCLPLLVVPMGMAGATLADFWPVAAIIVLSFFAFRGFDILKTEPADSLQAIPGGWGVLLDDLVAGLYALAVVALAHLFI